MFGYVRPNSAELKVKEQELYRSVYCGVCRGLGKCTGQCSRFTLSYDAAFLALFRMAVQKEDFQIKRRRCVAHPFRKRNMLEICEATRYAAKVNATLAYYHVLDDISDKRGFRRLLAISLKPTAKRWKKRAKIDSALCEKIESALQAQTELESQNCPSVDAAAQPFGTLLSAVFAYGLPQGPLSRIGAEFGLHLGRCIYYIDAADDYETDAKRNQYNPFVCAASSPKGNRVLRDAAVHELQAATEALSLIDVQDTGAYAILQNILYDGLVRKIHTLLELPLPELENNPSSLYAQIERQDLT